MRTVGVSSLLLLLAALPALPCPAAPPTRTQLVAKYGAQALVSKGKIPAFYDPAHLAQPPVVSATAAILLDAATGQMLWEKNADARRFPASTTKILTALLFVEATPPDAVITCRDPNIRKIEESSLHILPGEQFGAEDLLRGTLLRSGNDGAVVMAEQVSGSVPAFADLMNRRAREIGATGSHFVNPNGLPDPDHYTTARDLAVIARAALENPRFADAVAQPERIIARSKVARDTRIVARVKPKFYDKFPGADGVKTGYTRAAGHCFVGSATRNGRRLISVVLHSWDSASADTIPLLSWGFARFPVVTVARKGQDAGAVPLRFGARDTVSVVAGDDVRAMTDVLVPNNGGFVTEIEPARGLEAPIARGQEVGRLLVKKAGKVVGVAPLLAGEDVARSAFRSAVGKATGGRMDPGKPFRVAVTALGGAGTLLLVLFGYENRAKRRRAERRRTRRSGPGGDAFAAPAKGDRRGGSRVAAAGRGNDRAGARAGGRGRCDHARHAG